VSWCQQSGDIDERRSLMSAVGCQTGTQQQGITALWLLANYRAYYFVAEAQVRE